MNLARPPNKYIEVNMSKKSTSSKNQFKSPTYQQRMIAEVDTAVAADRKKTSASGKASKKSSKLKTKKIAAKDSTSVSKKTLGAKKKIAPAKKATKATNKVTKKAAKAAPEKKTVTSRPKAPSIKTGNDSTNNSFSQLPKDFTGIWLIDSNIWMDRDYKNFIKALGQASKSEKINIIMPREQFDEICNLKRKANFNSKSANEARSAISLIEKLQMSGASIELADMGIEAKSVYSLLMTLNCGSV